MNGRSPVVVPGAKALFEWIQRQGLNQREAAVKIGIGHDYLNHILHNRSSVGLATALRLERVTGIPVEDWNSTDVDKRELTAPAKSRKR